jgi:DNA-binding transcriptional ArsR family regulator
MNSGSVFNHKPETGWFSLDVRSLDPAVIATIEDAVRDVLATVAAETSIALTMEPYQLTPGGQIAGARESRLVRASASIARHLGIEPVLSDAGSSNMNVAVAGGTPAIGLGGERGGRRGFADEWADVPTLMRTARHVLLLAATDALDTGQSLLSFHLRTLKDAGLVTDRRAGRWVHYSLNGDALADLEGFLRSLREASAAPSRHG